MEIIIFLLAAQELVLALSEKKGIPLEKVVGHRHILASKRRSDPSADFDWKYVTGYNRRHNFGNLLLREQPEGIASLPPSDEQTIQ